MHQILFACVSLKSNKYMNSTIIFFVPADPELQNSNKKKQYYKGDEGCTDYSL